MPKLARHESMFFKELKKQDLHVCCDDIQLQKQNEDADVEQDKSSCCDEVDGGSRQPRPRHVSDIQLTSHQPHHAAAAADDDHDHDDDSDATEFTSLQSRTCLSFSISQHDIVTCNISASKICCTDLFTFVSFSLHCCIMQSLVQCCL